MATHLVLNQRVAIKFLRREAMADEDAVHRFVREAQAAAKVQSEHVVRVQDVAMLPDGTPYIVMEYLEGELLATMLTSRGALPVREAIKYALQTCEALAETHAAGIVHGDLKPENIYITGAGDATAPRRVKLLDFGISKIVFEERRKPNPKSLMGTPAYMAPEQFESGIVDHASDLWALGILIYEMLSGQPPFIAETAEEICERVMNEPLTPVLRPDMPEGLDVVIARCLQKEPSLRYPNVLELTAALEDFSPAESSLQRLEHVTGKTKNVRMSQRLVPTVVVANRKTNYGTWLVAAVGVIATVGVVLVLLGATPRFLKHTDPDPTPGTTSASAAAPTTALSAEANAGAPATSTTNNTTPTPNPSATTPALTMSVAVAPAASSAPKKLRLLPPKTKHEPTPSPSPAPTPEGDRFGTRK